jgi:hypothetical protein
MLITKLEIGAIGIDFSRRTSWWVREGLRRARTWKSMKNGDFLSNVYEYNKSSNMYRIHIFLDETGCVLNEKMMADVTIMVPELEIDKKNSKIHISEKKSTGPGSCILTGGEGGRSSYH